MLSDVHLKLEFIMMFSILVGNFGRKNFAENRLAKTLTNCQTSQCITELPCVTIHTSDATISYIVIIVFLIIVIEKKAIS